MICEAVQEEILHRPGENMNVEPVSPLGEAAVL